MVNKVQPLIGIIGGKGKMGKKFAEFFEKSGHKVLISDKRTALTNRALAKKADVVIVSVPIDRTEKVIEKIAPHLKPSSLLMDLTSLKVGPMQAMKKTKASTLGCHPLFGPTNSLAGQVIVLCPGRGKKWFTWLKNLLTQNKLIVRQLTAKKHDELMAYVQVLSHFSDIALAEALRQSGLKMSDFLSFQSPAYRLKLDMMGRILNQDPNLYGNIQIQNPLSNQVIETFLKSAQKLAEFTQKKDLKGFERAFKSAARYLGDFKKQAMQESDELIEKLIGPQLPNSPTFMGSETIAVLGPKNTYSDLALRSLYPKAKAYFASSITEVFELVESGKIKEGLVPLENSLTGSVRETLDELVVKKVRIDRVISQKIHLALAGVKKISLKSIEVIYSHPQPLLQSRQFLKKQCPKALTIPVSSTAEALRRVVGEKNPKVAAIAAPFAAKAHKLHLLKTAVEDNKTNATTFALIRKKNTPRITSKTKNLTLIAFNFGQDTSGSLHGVLQIFAEAKINLTKIESRPNPKMPGKHVFYIEFEGRTDRKPIQLALKKVKKQVDQFKLLGEF